MKIAGMTWKGSDLNVLFIIHVGFVSNGEYNSFRAMGYTRPLSVLKIRSMARNKYSNAPAHWYNNSLCCMYFYPLIYS